QITPLLCLAGGVGAAAAMDHLRARWPSYVPARLGPALLLLVAAWASWSAGSDRLRTARIERGARIAPMARACAEVPADSVLITEEPVVAGLVCPPTQHVIDLPSLLWTDEPRLRARVAQGEVFYL